MKSLIAVTAALAATTFVSLANAGTYTYTFNDMTWVPNQAKDSYNYARYWENRGTDRWGTVWESPYTFSSSYPTESHWEHFHIGFRGQDECYDVNTQSLGRYVGGTCVGLDPVANRGPFTTMSGQGLYFQVVTDAGAAVPFVVKNIDVHNPSNQAIKLFVRKTDGGWFFWNSLHGHLNGSPSYYRWTLTSGYTGKFTAMAWRAVDGAGYFSMVGRVQVTD